MGQCMVRPSIESGMSYEFDLGQVYTGASSGQQKSRQGQEGPGPGAIYKAGQVEPTRDTLEPVQGKGTVQTYVPVPHCGKLIGPA